LVVYSISYVIVICQQLFFDCVGVLYKIISNLI